MSQPLPAQYLATPRQFHTNTNPVMTWPTGGTVGGLRAAVVQQMIVAPINTNMAAQGWDARKVAGLLSIPESTFYGVLAGTSLLHVAHVGALLAFSDQLPAMDAIRERILLVTAQGTLATRIRAAGGVPGDLLPRTQAQRRALEMLSALTVRVIERTEDDDARDRALGEAAIPPLTESARRLASAHGFPNKPGEALPAPLLVSHLPGNPEPVGVDGFLTPDGPLLTGDLPPDWVRTVAEPGWAIIDDHFIVAVRGSDGTGRPKNVIALTLAPLGDNEAESPPEQRTWTYRSAPARIAWDAGEPRLGAIASH